MSGLSASGIVIFGWVFGLITCYKAKRTNANLLFYMGLCIICVGGCWLGNLVDFMIILLTGKNMDNSYGLYGILSWIWIPPFMILAMYVFTSLLIPEKKWYILAIIGVLGIIFEILLFVDPSSFLTYNYPATSGEDLIDDNIAFNSPAGILYIVGALIVLIFGGFGFLIKGIQSADVIRKKFFLVSTATFIFTIFGTLDASIPAGIILIFVRIGVLCSLWFFYFGLREEPEKTEKIRPKKEVKVEGDLFRISKRPDQITEEEVSISKEKKICLVCKGKISGHNYVCPECETFYCDKCYNALTNLENACWACNTQLDESKPVKPFKREEEEKVRIAGVSKKGKGDVK